MERIVRHITQQLVSRLSGRKDFYTPEYLREIELPEFIVERVEVEMERNLDDSVVPPYTEWADMNNETVQKAWEQFIEAIVAEARMPKIYAQSVIETAVADTMEIMIQPRQNIPEAIFGPDKALDIKSIEKRIKAVTVYKHLGMAVLRYMNRRNLKALTYEQCENIIQKVDEKLVEKYNPLNWTQLLSPLFDLLQNNVDTTLLRLFFEDKGLNRIARKLDMLNTSLSKTQLIEVLSSTDLLDLEGYEDSQSSLFEDDSAGNPDQQMKDASGAEGGRELYPGGPKIQPFDLDLNFGEEKKEKPKKEKPESDDAILSTFHKRRSYYGPDEEAEDEFDEETRKPTAGSEEKDENEDDASEEITDREEQDPEFPSSADVDEFADEFKSEQELEKSSEHEEKSFITGDQEESTGTVKTSSADGQSEDEEDKPLHKLFVFDEEALQERDLESEEEETVDDSDSLNAIFETEEHDMDEVSDDVDEIADEEPVETGDEATPVWQSFLQREDLEDELPDENSDDWLDQLEKTERTENKGSTDSNILDISSIYKEHGEENSEHRLSDWLYPDKKRFVREIFNDSEKSYQNALAEISKCEDWKSASRYIEEKIFSKNMIDMYSDEAVDFTDKLQSYFKEFKSSETTNNG